jgi:hypothetical protein
MLDQAPNLDKLAVWEEEADKLTLALASARVIHKAADIRAAGDQAAIPLSLLCCLLILVILTPRTSSNSTPPVPKPICPAPCVCSIVA